MFAFSTPARLMLRPFRGYRELSPAERGHGKPTVAGGVATTVSPNQPLEAVLAEIHAQHGVAIAAHPVRHFWRAERPLSPLAPSARAYRAQNANASSM